MHGPADEAAGEEIKDSNENIDSLGPVRMQVASVAQLDRVA